MLFLQITFTIISALFLAAAIPVGALVDWAWALACGFCALLFFSLMLLCKQSLAMKKPPEQKAEQNTDESEQEK